MAAAMKVIVDGKSLEIEVGSKVTHVVEELHPDRVKPGPHSFVVCEINGVMKDLWSDLNEGDVIRLISIDSSEGLSVLRHSTAHVLAQAVQEKFAQTRLGIGPPITDGFYYDFEPEHPFTPDDLSALESGMKKIIKDGQRFKRRVVTEDEALMELKEEKYKCELIQLKSGDSAEGASEIGRAHV